MSALRTTQSSPPSRAAATQPAATAGVRFWDRMAHRYAASAIADTAGYERTLARVSTLLAPEHAVLEIGCGTGASALRLASRCGRLLAPDSSPAMIAMARQRWRAQPSAQLSFAVADAQAALQENELRALTADLRVAINEAQSSLRAGLAEAEQTLQSLRETSLHKATAAA